MKDCQCYIFLEVCFLKILKSALCDDNLSLTVVVLLFLDPNDTFFLAPNYTFLYFQIYLGLYVRKFNDHAEDFLILRLDLVNCVRKVLGREHIHRERQWYLFPSF